jgi:hypothetical protein
MAERVDVDDVRFCKCMSTRHSGVAGAYPKGCALLGPELSPKEKKPLPYWDF